MTMPARPFGQRGAEASIAPLRARSSKNEEAITTILASILGGAAFWIFGSLGGDGSAPLRPSVAQATDPVSREYGYIDQDNGTYSTSSSIRSIRRLASSSLPCRVRVSSYPILPRR